MYLQAMDVIKQEIASGELAGRITLGRIQEMTGTTIGTARKAANELVAEGILMNHPGAPYTIEATPAEAAAKRLTLEELTEEVGRLRKEVADLRERVGRMAAQLATVAKKPRGSKREQADAAADGGRR